MWITWSGAAIVAIACGAIGCSSSSGGSGGGDPPTSCDPTQMTGVYAQTFTTLSGNCGDIPMQLLQFNQGMSVTGTQSGSTTCSVAASQTLDNDCKVESTLTCQGGSLDGETITVVLQQTGNDASSYSGQESFTGPACVGDYSFTEVRQ